MTTDILVLNDLINVSTNVVKFTEIIANYGKCKKKKGFECVTCLYDLDYTTAKHKHTNPNIELGRGRKKKEREKLLW